MIAAAAESADATSAYGVEGGSSSSSSAHPREKAFSAASPEPSLVTPLAASPTTEAAAERMIAAAAAESEDATLAFGVAGGSSSSSSAPPREKAAATVPVATAALGRPLLPPLPPFTTVPTGTTAEAVDCAPAVASTAASETASTAAVLAPSVPLVELAPASTSTSAGPPSGGTPSQRLMLRLQILDGSGEEVRSDIYVDTRDTVGDLKARQFHQEVARGWVPRCIFRGRVLPDTETLGSLPSGSLLQCYLHKAQAAPTTADLDPFESWLRFAAGGDSGRGPVCNKQQDVIFHALLAVGLAIAWHAYFSERRNFDHFGRFSLFLFSFMWVYVCLGDLLRPRTSDEPRPEPPSLVEGSGAASVGADRPDTPR
eukprot:TRINITY_DN38393_c0_g1_i1.p1 TRINITY_DN38393_c0_g1~~TRINITY_DN38393_c0_g1_i1.p1  ORF type:complete len:423 (+),score=86.53 TRINITY_DN38393_c0_g1_i1:159-1271(+)